MLSLPLVLSSQASSIPPPSRLARSSQEARLPMELCPDFDPHPNVRRRSEKCQKHDEMLLQGLPFGSPPAPADMGDDPCAWTFHCRTDTPSMNSSSTGRKNALWWDASLVAPAKSVRKPCETSRGRGWCVPLKKYEIVIRYATNLSRKSCFYWRKVKTAYYCKVDRPLPSNSRVKTVSLSI